jgi:tRNA1Val (adenine37-N6)-methyltransferase
LNWRRASPRSRQAAGRTTGRITGRRDAVRTIIARTAVTANPDGSALSGTAERNAVGTAARDVRIITTARSSAVRRRRRTNPGTGRTAGRKIDRTIVRTTAPARDVTGKTGGTGQEGNLSRMKMKEIHLKPGERIDDLQRNGYGIIQNPEKFCFGMDAVLLTGFARAGEQDVLLDLGTGTGIIPLLMSAKYHCAHLTGLEIQEESADMARRSVAMNGLEDKIDIVTGDIKEADQCFQSASFDCITCNPPYMIGKHGLANPEAPKAIARHEILCTLEDVVRVTAKLLKPGGHFFLVHRPFRLAEIMTTLSQYKLEPKRMQLVYPYVDREPNMVLVEAVRGGRPRMTVEKPLIIFERQGVYMPEIRDVYGF